MGLTVVGTELPLLPREEIRSTLESVPKDKNVIDVFQNLHKQRHNLRVETYRYTWQI